MQKIPLDDNSSKGTLVRITGLEPAHRKTLDPKSSASANSAISAYDITDKQKLVCYFV